MTKDKLMTIYRTMNGFIAEINQYNEDENDFDLLSFDTDHSDINKRILILYELKNILFDFNNKYSDIKDNIEIYSTYGTKSSFELRLKAWLDHEYYKYSEDMIHDLMIVFEKYDV